MRANGSLELGTYLIGETSTTTWAFPIEVVDMTSNSDNIISGNVVRSATLSPWFVSFRSPTTLGVVFNVYDNTGAAQSSASCRAGLKGKWK